MKKNRELLNIIGNIDDDMIENARPGRIKKKSRKTVFISIASTAAVLAVMAGLQYQYIFKPLSDAGKGNTQIPAATEIVSETDNAENSGVPQSYTVKKITQEQYSSLRKLECINGEIYCIYGTVLDNSRITVETSGKKYYFEDNIIGNIKNSGPGNEDILGGAVTENHIFFMCNGVLVSADRDDEVIYLTEGGELHHEMDLSGSTYFIGADTSENAYVLNAEHDGRLILMKYSPEMILLESSEINVYGYDPVHIFNTASGFDGMRLEDNCLVIEYSGECELKYDFSTGEYVSEQKFSLSHLDQNIGEGIYRSGTYLYAYDSEGKTVLTLLRYDITENGRTESGNSPDFVDINGEDKNMHTLISCIDDYMYVRCEPVTIPAEVKCIYDSEGSILSTETVATFDEIYMTESELLLNKFHRPLVYNGTGDFSPDQMTELPGSVLGSTGFSSKELPEGYYVSFAAECSDGSVICVLAPGSPYAEVNFAEGPEFFHKLAVVTPDGKYREISNEKVSEMIKGAQAKPSPQKDGTVLFVSDNVFYSYNVNDDTLTELCIFDTDWYNILTGEISKVNEKTYAFPRSALSSNSTEFYIVNLS